MQKAGLIKLVIMVSGRRTSGTVRKSAFVNCFVELTLEDLCKPKSVKHGLWELKNDSRWRFAKEIYDNNAYEAVHKVNACVTSAFLLWETGLMNILKPITQS